MTLMTSSDRESIAARKARTATKQASHALSAASRRLFRVQRAVREALDIHARAVAADAAARAAHFDLLFPNFRSEK
jgi:hypothetical protein